MRFLALTILLALASPLSAGAQERAESRHKDDEQREAVERKVAAEPDAVVSLCVASGDVIVRGWEKNEVRARSAQAGGIDLKASKSAGAGKGVEVLVSDDPQDEDGSGSASCDATSDIELDVPRGATVRIKVREGDVDVTDVAEAHVESLNGDVSVRRAGVATDVSCLSGDVTFSDSRGRARLRSVSGDVEAANVAPFAAGDDLIVTSTSGDVSLERVGHASVKGTVISGGVRMSGPLVSRGSYEFTSTSGDVTLELPPDASFKVNARVVFSGEIITDFPVTATVAPVRASAPEPPDSPEPPDFPGKPGKHKPPKVKPPKEPTNQTTLAGVVGKGGAELKLTSFSGTVYLKKQ